MKDPLVFTPPMLDVMRELMNIGVGRAARAIAELSGREVVLRVLEIEVLGLQDPGQFSELRGQGNLRVSQRFVGGLEGCGLFVLNRSGAARLAQLLLGKSDDHVAFDELDQGALLELGNIVVGSAVGLLAAELELEVRYELPQLQLRGVKEVADFFADIRPASDKRGLLMRAALSLRDDMINGYLILFLPGPGLAVLQDRLAPLAS